MPRDPYFPRWRYLLMQAVMWLILGATVALAALLDRHLRLAQNIDFSSPITEAPVTFSLPAGWKTWTRQAEGDAIVHVATDSTGGIDRTLTISLQRIPHTMPPAEYILRALPISGQLSRDDFRSITIDGWPAANLHWAAQAVSLETSGDVEFSSTSAVVLPGYQAVMIRLTKNKGAPLDAADDRLYRQVLDRIHISTTRPSDGGMLQLSSSVSASVPADMQLYPQPDPLRNDRFAAEITDDGGWVSAEFVPVAVSEHQPTASLLTALAVREELDLGIADLSRAWLNCQVAPQGPDHWTLTPQQPQEDSVIPLRVAHLITGDGSYGLVVILSAEPPADASDLDRLWDQLAGNIHVGKTPALVDALNTGAALYRSASPGLPSESWWTWTRGSTPIGFTHRFSDRDSQYVVRYTARRNWNGTVTAALQQWGTDSATGPWADMKRFDAEANLDNPLVPFGDQLTTVSDWITTIYRDRANRETRNNIRFDPPAFVLSQNFPALLANVGPTPTAFWTDRFPGVEAEIVPTPVLVLASRVLGPTGFHTVEAQVNGSAQLSRWYFHPDHSLDHADFAGDLHLHTSTEAEVDAAFAGDPRLTIQPH
jgi:hypothetical protein